MAFEAGHVLLASDLNAKLPILARCTSALTRTSTTTLADVTGMAIALEADKLYALDGYIAYTAGATGDLKVAFTVPASTTGHWALYCIAVASTASVGDLDARRQTAYGAATTQSAGGSDSFGGDLMCLIRGYIDTAGTAGNIQLQAAQNTSSGTSTVIQVGSWMRVWELT